MLIGVRRRKEINIRTRKNPFGGEVPALVDVDIFEKVAEECAAKDAAARLLFGDPGEIEK